jgi:MFS family permease
LNPFGVFLLILGSVLGGLGAAIVWVSQGGFMTALFEKYQRPNHYHGRYFGLLNMIVFSNILLGSVVTTFGLGFMGDTEYFIILTVLGGASVVFGVFLL